MKELHAVWAVECVEHDRCQAKFGPSGVAEVAAGGDEDIAAIAELPEEFGDVFGFLDVVEDEQPAWVGLQVGQCPGSGVGERGHGVQAFGEGGQAECDVVGGVCGDPPPQRIPIASAVGVMQSKFGLADATQAADGLPDDADLCGEGAVKASQVAAHEYCRLRGQVVDSLNVVGFGCGGYRDGCLVEGCAPEVHPSVVGGRECWTSVRGVCWWFGGELAPSADDDCHCYNGGSYGKDGQCRPGSQWNSGRARGPAVRVGIDSVNRVRDANSQRCLEHGKHHRDRSRFAVLRHRSPSGVGPLRSIEEVLRQSEHPPVEVNVCRFVSASCYITPGLGKKRLDRLQAADVQIWINEVARTCQCCSQGKDAKRPREKQRCCALSRCCNDLPSANTVQHIRRVLRTILSQAEIDGQVGQNVARRVKLPAMRKGKRKSWTTEEARRFLESARDDEDSLYAAYVLVLVLGMRKGEMLGLGWDSIDLDRAELSIDWQLQRIRDRLVRRQTKTEGSEAVLPLPDICAVALRQRRIDQETARVDAGEVWQESPLVFTTPLGTPKEPRNFNRFWNRRCDLAGVRRITVHDARRTCASLLTDLDVHPRVVMQILRHANFAITMEIYTQVSSQATRDALKRLGESLDQ